MAKNDFEHLTLNTPITKKVVCFSCLLKCLRSLYGKQCGPRSDCSYRSSLFWVHTVCFYTSILGTDMAQKVFFCVPYEFLCAYGTMAWPRLIPVSMKLLSYHTGHERPSPNIGNGPIMNIPYIKTLSYSGL